MISPGKYSMFIIWEECLWCCLGWSVLYMSELVDLWCRVLLSYLSSIWVFYILFSSIAQSCLTLCNPWTAACQALSITNSQSLLKCMSVESVMPSNHLILCCPLLLLPSVFALHCYILHYSILYYWKCNIEVSNSYRKTIYSFNT